MAYPPTPPPATRANTTPQVDNHPGDHNLLSGNVSDLVTELGSGPSGGWSDLTARLVDHVIKQQAGGVDVGSTQTIKGPLTIDTGHLFTALGGVSVTGTIVASGKITGANYDVASGGIIDWAADTTGDKIVLFGNTPLSAGAYGFGVLAGNQLSYYSPGLHAFRVNNTTRLLVEADRVEVRGAQPDTLHLVSTTENIGNYIAFHDPTDRKGYIGYPSNLELWINNEEGKVVIDPESVDGGGGDGAIYLHNALNATTDSGTGFSLRGPLSKTRSAAVGEGEVALFTLWTQTGTDRHVVMLCDSGANRLQLRNEANTVHVPITASSFDVGSSIVEKDRIRRARDERGILETTITADRTTAFEQHQRLVDEIVLFDDKAPIRALVWAGCDVHGDDRDTCTAARCRNADTVVDIQHRCSEFAHCAGTDEHPCWDVEQHIDRTSVPTERLIDIYPKAVSRDATGRHIGNNVYQLVMEMANTIGHLIDEVTELRAQVDAR